MRKVGWTKTYIKEEVNSVRSDFSNKQYFLSEGPKDDSGRFIDYLLLAEDNRPIALIKAKKFSKSEDDGRAQARTYLNDIRGQTNETLPYFLTNGNKWLFIDQDGVERPVSGPFSQADLMRRNLQEKIDPTKVSISRIVDRPRNVIIVKQIMEHFKTGHRSGLISMATGTGKTRVAMSIIDVINEG